MTTTTLDLRAATLPLRITRGDTLTVTIEYESGEDLSGSTWDAAILDRPDGDLVLALDVDTSSATAGTVVVRATADDIAALPASAVWYVTRVVGSEQTTLVSGPVAVAGRGARSRAGWSTTEITVVAGAATVTIDADAVDLSVDGGSPLAGFASQIDGGDPGSVYGGTTAVTGGSA